MQKSTSIQTYQILENKPNVSLTAYIAGKSGEMPFNEKRKALLVIPGGGYHWCSDREGDPVALHFLAQGFNTFVLEYSTAHNADVTWPSPLVDASAAMKFIRDHAEDFCIDPKYVFAIGFSAGGHLAASLATLWDDDEIEKMLGKKAFNAALADHITKPKGKPTLAPESDKREPYNSAASDFAGVANG